MHHLFFVCDTLNAKQQSIRLNQDFLIVRAPLIFVCKTARYTPQATFFNDVYNTYLCMRVTLPRAHINVPG